MYIVRITTTKQPRYLVRDIEQHSSTWRYQIERATKYTAKEDAVSIVDTYLTGMRCEIIEIVEEG